jgi:hypothetical protein
MNSNDGLDKKRCTRCTLINRRHTLIALAFAVLAVAGGRAALGQVPESANLGGFTLSIGGGVSEYYIQYGQRKNLGLTGSVDADSTRHFGIETEGRWLADHTPADIQIKTYLAGARYHFNVGKSWQPYTKALLGVGMCRFPYNYAYGSYFVIAPGGGVDYRLTRGWSVRVDGEYQYWPHFTFRAMSSAGLSVGVRYYILRGRSSQR